MQRGALVVVCLWALALAHPGAVDAATWQSPFTLSTLAQSALGPQLDVNAAGEAVAVWQRRAGNAPPERYSVQTAIRPAGGSFGPRQSLSPAGIDARFPQAALDAAGNAVAVWLRFPGEGTGPNPVVQAARRPAGGAFGPPENLSLEYLDASEPHVAVAGNGDAVAIWTQSNGTNRIVATASRPAGGRWSAVQEISAPGQDASAPQVTIDGTGGAVAVWTRWNGANRIVQAAVRPPRGLLAVAPAFGPPQDISAFGTNGFVPQVAADEAGNAIAVWVRFNGRTAVAQAALRPAGAAFGLATDLSAVEQHIGPPQIAMNAAGAATVVWSRTREDTDVVQAVSRPPGGQFGLPEQLSDAPLVGDAPQVAVDPAGNAVVVWLIRDRWMVQSAARPAGGIFGRPENLAGMARLALGPQVALDAAGASTAIWTRAIDGSALAVQGKTRGPVAPGSEPPPLLVLDRLAAAPRRFSRLRSARVSFRLSRPASVVLKVRQILGGRRSDGRCVKPQRRLRRLPACTRRITRATVRMDFDSAGTKTYLLRRHLEGWTLAPGRYRLRVSAGAPGVITRDPPRTIDVEMLRG